MWPFSNFSLFVSNSQGKYFDWEYIVLSKELFASHSKCVLNTHVLWCEPVIVAMGLAPFGSHNFLLIREDIMCTNI